jgi:hypothetical protein
MQGRSVTKVETAYHSTHHHLHVARIKDRTTGRHTIIVSSLRSPTFYSTEIRCLLEISTILELWAACLAITDIEPPFWKATHLYNTIDLTPLGDVTWESFGLQYNGHQPVENTPLWMQAEYDVWFRDPRTVIHNLLSNPDFKSGFDYAPYQEYAAGVHRFQDFMSGNWAWKQAVGLQYSVGDLVLMPITVGYYR